MLMRFDKGKLPLVDCTVTRNLEGTVDFIHLERVRFFPSNILTVLPPFDDESLEIAILLFGVVEKHSAFHTVDRVDGPDHFSGVTVSRQNDILQVRGLA
jgi:hypothetical protein